LAFCKILFEDATCLEKLTANDFFDALSAFLTNAFALESRKTGILLIAIAIIVAL
jgi:hypothetical protein